MYDRRNILATCYSHVEQPHPWRKLYSHSYCVLFHVNKLNSNRCYSIRLLFALSLSLSLPLCFSRSISPYLSFPLCLHRPWNFAWETSNVRISGWCVIFRYFDILRYVIFSTFFFSTKCICFHFQCACVFWLWAQDKHEYAFSHLPLRFSAFSRCVFSFYFAHKMYETNCVTFYYLFGRFFGGLLNIVSIYSECVIWEFTEK